MPVLSVITINYNNKAGLEKTISSIAGQTAGNIEFIIIDGGSTDGSTDLIGANNKLISYSVSEKDNGIYDAQNKGIQRATGDYLLFLNSGDTLYNNTVISEFCAFVSDKTCGIVYGKSNLLFSGKPDEILSPPKKLDTFYFFKHTINHQACFMNRSLFSEYGLYDTKYRICADFDLFFKIFVKAPESYRYFDAIVCNYEIGGSSSDKKNYDRVVSEKFSILKKNLPKKEYDKFYAEYRKEIPLKYRIFGGIYKIPFFGRLFKGIFKIVKGNGE